jgi:hypothetical protein
MTRKEVIPMKQNNQNQMQNKNQNLNQAQNQVQNRNQVQNQSQTQKQMKNQKDGNTQAITMPGTHDAQSKVNHPGVENVRRAKNFVDENKK